MARVERLAFRQTLRAWSVRDQAEPKEIAYIAYCVVLLCLIVVAPVVRAIWVLLSTPAAVAVLSSPEFGSLATAGIFALLALVCAPWSAPAVRRGFLAHVLASSAIPYSTSFRRPVGNMLTVAITASMGAAALGQSVLLAAGVVLVWDLVFTLVSAASIATIATVCALASQRSARFSGAAAICFTAVAVAMAVWPPALSGVALTTPWGAGIVVACAIGCFAMIGRLLRSMMPAAISEASERMDAVVTGVALMDSDAVTRAFSQGPSIGRRWNATPRLAITLALPFAAFVGSLRNPARFVRGVAVLAAGLALAGITISPWVTGTAAALIYMSLGPFADGVRQAADVVRSPPVYGISDVRFMLSHAMFPLAFVLIFSIIALPVGGVGGWLTAVVAGVTAVIARVFAALTPAAPLSLLMPIPTAFGDMAAFLRLLWAVQGVLLAVVLAVFVASAATNSGAIIATIVCFFAAITVVGRWKSRR